MDIPRKEFFKEVGLLSIPLIVVYSCTNKMRKAL